MSDVVEAALSVRMNQFMMKSPAPVMYNDFVTLLKKIKTLTSPTATRQRFVGFSGWFHPSVFRFYDKPFLLFESTCFSALISESPSTLMYKCFEALVNRRAIFLDSNRVLKSFKTLKLHKKQETRCQRLKFSLLTLLTYFRYFRWKFELLEKRRTSRKVFQFQCTTGFLQTQKRPSSFNHKDWTYKLPSSRGTSICSSVILLKHTKCVFAFPLAELAGLSANETSCFLQHLISIGLFVAPSLLDELGSMHYYC